VKEKLTIVTFSKNITSSKNDESCKMALCHTWAEIVGSSTTKNKNFAEFHR
jgi:hypothetical protein